MNAEKRRELLEGILADSAVPVSASALAATLNVSRQIIVGDVALLRAGGALISATPRGYVVKNSDDTNSCTIACLHSREDLLDELYTIVDSGCSVLDVIVSHPVYGEITANLSISSRFDADVFWQSLADNKAAPLSQLTDNIHLHTITYPSKTALKHCVSSLFDKGYICTPSKSD